MGRRGWIVGIFLIVVSMGFVSAALAGGAARFEISPVRGASAILIEPTTGQVLYEQNADLPRSPASIAKIMLELIVLERVQEGTLHLDDSIHVSGWASKIGGSQAYLAEGEVFALEDLMKAITIASANDACVAVAEYIAGSPEGFVDLMNQKARELGLANTRYSNVHGLDDDPVDVNVTTARDIATIARHLITMPHVLEWSSLVEAPFRDGTFILHNTNKLLGHFPGIDGLKTGYTRRAGFCLCATAERNGLRFISVVMGADSERHRFSESARLLGAGFAQLRREVLAEAGKPCGAPLRVENGSPREVLAQPAAPLFVTMLRGEERPSVRLVPRFALRAPIAAGDTVGTYEVAAPNGYVIEMPAVASRRIRKANIFERFAGLLKPNKN